MRGATFQKPLICYAVCLDNLLNLMKGKAEFTPPTRWLSIPGANRPRGKWLGRYGSAFVQAAQPTTFRTAKSENFGRRA
jgi:hypothetical protein